MPRYDADDDAFNSRLRSGRIARAQSGGFMANTLMQTGLIVFTVAGFLLTSLRLPDYGVIANLIGQIFWLYSSYQAWREANQVGMFVCSVLVTLILLYGVENYWLGLLPRWNPIVNDLCK